MLTENKKLDAKIQKARALKRETDAIMKQIRKSCIREIKQYMLRYEITLEDLAEAFASKEKAAPAQSESKKEKRAAKPMYRSADGKQTWSGRGIMAKWLRKEVEAGHAKEEFLIKE